MPKKLPDDTVYMKRNGKYIPVGKAHTIDFIGYGCYFVESKKYSKGIRRIEGVPDPDFIGLETAARMCIDDVCKSYYQAMIDKKLVSNYELVEAVINGILETAKAHKELMLDTIKNG
jgi:hypothetical protein